MKSVYLSRAFYLSLVLLTACGGSSSDSPNSGVEPDVPPKNMTQLKTQVDAFNAKWQAYFEENDIDCSQSNPHLDCETIVTNFSDGQFNPDKVDEQQTILVLDSGIKMSAALRYRSRIKAVYRYDPDLYAFVVDNPNVSISKIGTNILKELDQFRVENEKTEQPSFIPAAWLEETGEIHNNKVNNDSRDDRTGTAYFGHGSKVFGYLVQSNPQAEFVVLDTANFLPFQQYTTQLCNKDVTAFDEIFENVAQSFYQTILVNENIEYINYSGGYTTDIIAQAWTNAGCDGVLTNTEAKALTLSMLPFYERLFNSDGVLGVQSGAWRMSEQAYPLDTLDFKNRVRVLPYTTKTEDTDLPPDGVVGERQPVVGFDDQFSQRQWVDLLVNFGTTGFMPVETNSTPKLTYDIFGMRVMPETEPHSSWAAPVALSQAIYLRNSQYQNETHSQNLVERLIDALAPQGCDYYPEFNGRCRIQDPLKHRQHEVYRLNYQP